MKITENIDWKINIADIETLAEYTLLSFYNPDTEEWNEFEIGEFKNDILAFVKFYDKNNIDYNVFYNGIRFDGPILEYIYRTYEDWMHLSGIEIARKIYMYAQDVISNSDYGAFLEYREDSFSVKILDCFTILGLDNAARRSSLKKVQFQLDLPSVEEMPIHHSRTNLTLEEIEQVKSYCRNDILSLYQLFKLVLGDTEHPIYKGNNQLELRLSIQEEFNINCLNYSDIKIGEELMIQSYLEETGIDRKDFPKKGTFRKEIKLKDCIPEYIKFSTETLQNLLKEVKKRIIKQDETIDYNFEFYGTKYELKNGGLHSKNKNEIYNSNEDYIIYTSDVGSFYPASKIQRKIYPKHLGIKFLNTYEKRYYKRIELKPLSKTDKKIKGICDAIKLQLNIIFGKLGSKESSFFDMKALLSVTIGNEFTLLKLVEECELNGFHVISVNTDGLEVLVKKEREAKYLEICEKWCNLTGYILEHDKYKWIKYSTINDYIALTVEGKVKKKGEYITEYDLWKNKSWRVVSLALEAYFIKGISPIDFIYNHKNIYDFCLMARASGDLHLEMQNSTNGEIKKLKKLVRYYLTTDKEWQLYKRGIGSTGKPANISLHADNELGSIHIKYFNQFEEKEDYNIDYRQYILKCLKIIDNVEKSNRVKSFLNSINETSQLSLF